VDEMKRTYSNGKITVFWDSDKCISAGECYGQLPQVFDVGKRPWVNLDAADAEEIKRVIDTCPTGALRYELPNAPASDTVTIRVIRNGPYKVAGKCKLIKADGHELDAGRTFALCRCANSKKMPLCDGSHYRVKFRVDD
jgi:uncharacterized Fe-S cluster protein YjdI